MRSRRGLHTRRPALPGSTSTKHRGLSRGSGGALVESVGAAGVVSPRLAVPSGGPSVALRVLLVSARPNRVCRGTAEQSGSRPPFPLGLALPPQAGSAPGYSTPKKPHPRRSCYEPRSASWRAPAWRLVRDHRCRTTSRSRPVTHVSPLDDVFLRQITRIATAAVRGAPLHH